MSLQNLEDILQHHRRASTPPETRRLDGSDWPRLQEVKTLLISLGRECQIDMAGNPP